MPLKDRKQRRQALKIPRFKLLGTIRLGYKAFNCKNKQCGQKRIPFTGNPTLCPKCGDPHTFPDGYKYFYPMEAGHFVLREAQDFLKVSDSETPTALDITFPFPDTEKSLSGNYMVWAGGIPVCKGDGETVTEAWPLSAQLVGKGNKERMQVKGAPGTPLVRDGVAVRPFNWNGVDFNRGDVVPCPGGGAGLYDHCEACRANVELRFAPADEEIYKFGYYLLRTNSGSNYDQMQELIEMVMEAFGPEAFPLIKFRLELIEKDSSHFDKNTQKRRKVSHYFLQLSVSDEAWRVIQLSRIKGFMETGQLPTTQTMRPALPAPAVVPDFDTDGEGVPAYAEQETFFEDEDVIDGDFTEEEVIEEQKPATPTETPENKPETAKTAKPEPKPAKPKKATSRAKDVQSAKPASTSIGAAKNRYMEAWNTLKQSCNGIPIPASGWGISEVDAGTAILERAVADIEAGEDAGRLCAIVAVQIKKVKK